MSVPQHQDTNRDAWLVIACSLYAVANLFLVFMAGLGRLGPTGSGIFIGLCTLSVILALCVLVLCLSLRLRRLTMGVSTALLLGIAGLNFWAAGVASAAV